MSITIKQKFVHMAPRKLRLVADTVRGKSTDLALKSLTVSPKVAAKPITAAIKSAISAAKQKDTGNNSLTIAAILIDEGPAMKRRILKSRGRASRMEHRMSHITVTVAPSAAKITPDKKSKVKE